MRANDLTEIDGAIGLLTLDAVAKPLNIGESRSSTSLHQLFGSAFKELLIILLLLR